MQGREQYHGAVPNEGGGGRGHPAAGQEAEERSASEEGWEGVGSGEEEQRRQGGGGGQRGQGERVQRTAVTQPASCDPSHSAGQEEAMICEVQGSEQHLATPAPDTSNAAWSGETPRALARPGSTFTLSSNLSSVEHCSVGLHLKWDEESEGCCQVCQGKQKEEVEAGVAE